ncbi:MAG: NUDIX domain-containing protein [Actinomycetota bacterium]
MPSLSAGIVLWRRGENGDVEVLLGHMGGPFWARKDAGAWSIPKGLVDDGEPPIDAARREFVEELGVVAPPGDLVPLGEIRQSSSKTVVAWALEGDLDVGAIEPGTFEMECPRGSGRVQEFPEIDRAEWFDLATAKEKCVRAQADLLDRLP